MSLVSIIIPSYNSSKTIVESLNSVLEQTYTNFEIIIVDDCSTDDTVSIVESYIIKHNDIRIRLIQLEINTGSPAVPRNIGLDNAKGDFIAFLDSDDLWLPQKLEIQVNEMSNKKIDFVCSSYFIRRNHKIVGCYTPPTFVNYDSLIHNNSIGCLTAILNSKLIGDLRFNKQGHEDYAFWLKILKKTDGVYSINEPLAIYNRTPNSISSNKKMLFSFFWNIYRKNESFSWLKSLYLCFRYAFFCFFFKYR